MQSEALITIGITCFREGEWLRECWQSVLAQTDDRWDAVLVMDGDADEATRRVFEGLHHQRLRKFAFAKNVGPYPARNKAFELTETPYHFYLDADDRLSSDAVACVLKGFANNPSANFIYGDIQEFGSSRRVVHTLRHVDALDFLSGQPIPGPACAYRKDAWERLGGFAQELSRGNGDYDFHIGLYEADLYGIHCEALIYHYRVGNPGKVSSTYCLTYYKSHEVIIDRHPGFFANERFRCLFLGYAYRRTAIDNYISGNFAEARRLARLAMASGIDRDKRLLFMALLCCLPAMLNRIALRTRQSLKELLKA